MVVKQSDVLIVFIFLYVSEGWRSYNWELVLLPKRFMSQWGGSDPRFCLVACLEGSKKVYENGRSPFRMRTDEAIRGYEKEKTRKAKCF